VCSKVSRRGHLEESSERRGIRAVVFISTIRRGPRHKKEEKVDEWKGG